MKRILSHILSAGVILFCGIAIGMALVLSLPNQRANSIHDWYSKRGIESAEYLEGIRARAEILAEAVTRNGSIVVFIQQAPELIYDPVVALVWRQNVIIVQVEADYWHSEMPPAGYEQFHFSAVHTADMCYDLMQLTQDVLWPPEGYNMPREFVGARIQDLYTSCFDGLAAIFAFLDLEAVDA